MIDRKALGTKVFGDPEQLDPADGHRLAGDPRLAKEEIDAARTSGAAVTVLEAAVLLEAGWQRDVDEVWC